jgi:hypothetical protein
MSGTTRSMKKNTTGQLPNTGNLRIYIRSLRHRRDAYFNLLWDRESVLLPCYHQLNPTMSLLAKRVKDMRHVAHLFTVDAQDTVSAAVTKNGLSSL